MPSTIRRLCVWHIYNKLPTKLRGYPAVARDEFVDVVRNSLSKAEFERRWIEYKCRYGLENNRWIKSLEMVKEDWVPVYLNSWFWAGQKSTQRSESMHAYFDHYVRRMSSLTDFLKEYEMALASKYEKELYEEYMTVWKSQACPTRFKWEVQLEEALTRNIFKLVQEELVKVLHCEKIDAVDENGCPIVDRPGVETIRIQDRFVVTNYRPDGMAFDVKYRAAGEYLECECKKQESCGYICCHIMRVMAIKRIEFLNTRYILPRWRRDVTRRHLTRFLRAGYPKMTPEYQVYLEVARVFDETVELVLHCPRRKEHLESRLVQVKNELLLMDDADVGPEIRDPPIVRCKGRPRARINRNQNGGRKACGQRRRL